MKLTELSPTFLKILTPTEWQTGVALAQADGLEFLCPVCFRKNNGRIGTHAIVCWKPSVPQTISPIPGRWNIVGTGFHDLTLKAGSSSVLLKEAECKAHFFVTNGEIQFCG